MTIFREVISGGDGTHLRVVVITHYQLLGALYILICNRLGSDDRADWKSAPERVPTR